MKVFLLLDSVVKRRDPVDPSQGPYCCWTSRAIVRQLDGATMTRIRQTRESLGQMETEIYQLELTRSPIVAQPEVSPNKTHMRRRKRSTVNHGYGTRTSRQPTSVYASEELVSAPPISSSDSDDSDYTRTSASSVSGSDTDSGQERSESDNSDWEEENGHSRTARARQPPTEQPETTEKSRRVRRRLRNQSSDDDNSDTEQKPPANDFSCISDIVDSEELAADHAGSSQDPVVKTEPAKKSMNKSLRKKTKSLPITRDPLRSPDDVPESQRFPEWLTTTFPKKSPFFPQIRDEVSIFGWLISSVLLNV